MFDDDNPQIIIADEACELKVNSSVILFLPVNKTWSSSKDPCTRYHCNLTAVGETHVDVQQVDCNATCSDGFAYKTQQGECCGSCVAMACLSGEKKFGVGEIWKSEDNCTVNECIDTGKGLVVAAYKKNCPKLKNCPEGSIELRDCCPYCNYRNQNQRK